MEEDGLKMDFEPIPQKVWFEMWQKARIRLRKQEQRELLRSLYEYRHKLINVKKNLELSLMFRCIYRDEEASKKKYKPKARDFKLRKYVEREDYPVYKILNNLEEAVQDIMRKTGLNPPAHTSIWKRKQKNVMLEDPDACSIEDTEVKVFEVDNILLEINQELNELSQKGPKYEECRDDLLFKKKDQKFYLEDIIGLHRFDKKNTSTDDRLQTLLSCMGSLKAGTTVLRYCFCKEVLNKRNRVFYLTGKVEEPMPVFEPIPEPEPMAEVEVEKSFERPDIKTVPGMSEMKAKCPNAEEMAKRFEKIVAREKMMDDERSARKEVKRKIREKRRKEAAAREPPAKLKDPNLATLNPYQLRMLRCAQMMAQSDNFIDLLKESTHKLKLSSNVLSRCINKAKAAADTERKYLSFLRSG